jgi:hypothetical protein
MSARRARDRASPRTPEVVVATIFSSSACEGYSTQHVVHEAVELRLRQRIRALELDRVLRREHEERQR